jgi:hypothetical protein
MTAKKEDPARAALAEREAFERWADGQTRFEGASRRFLALNNAYIDFDLHGAWKAWQARAALSHPAGASAQQAARWVIVCETVLDVGRGGDVRTGGRPELGYALLSQAATFASEDAARAAHHEAGLPLGWVIMPLSRLLPDVALATPQQAEQASDAQDAARPRLTVRLTAFPESNGKRNWTAMFVRVKPFDGLIGNCGGITIARGEHWNRVAYEAECAKFLLGERDTEPFILDYGDDIATPDLWAGARERAAITKDQA